MNRVLEWKGHSFIAMPARVYLGMVFILASLHKIADPGAFAVDIATYDILPLSLINVMAIALPWIEVVAGVLLVLGVRSRGSAWLIVGMMAMFMVALLMALHNGLDMSCGCFASSSMEGDDAISHMTVLRDTGWLALGMYIVVFDGRPIGLEMIYKKFKSS